MRTHDLMIELAKEPLGVAGILVAKEFIPEDIMSKMLIVPYTPNEKATILIEAVKNMIKLAPSKFTEFLEILSEMTNAKDVVESLRSTYRSELIMILTFDMRTKITFSAKTNVMINKDTVFRTLDNLSSSFVSSFYYIDCPTILILTNFRLDSVYIMAK